MQLYKIGINLNQVVKIHDVNLYSIKVSTSSALLILAKEYQNQIIIKAEVIEKQPGFQQFVHANFYNQNGMLKTISKLASTTPNSNAFILLPNVTTLMQRIQDHNNQRCEPLLRNGSSNNY